MLPKIAHRGQLKSPNDSGAIALAESRVQAVWGKEKTSETLQPKKPALSKSWGWKKKKNKFSSSGGGSSPPSSDCSSPSSPTEANGSLQETWGCPGYKLFTIAAFVEDPLERTGSEMGETPECHVFFSPCQRWCYAFQHGILLRQWRIGTSEPGTFVVTTLKEGGPSVRCDAVACLKLDGILGRGAKDHRFQCFVAG